MKYSAKTERTGLVQIYTGEGKGKTTASLGLLLRSWGHDHRLLFLQFMKAEPGIGEIVALERLQVPVIQTGLDHWVSPRGVTDEDREAAAAGLAKAREFVMSGDYDVVVLDEVWTAVRFDLLPLADVLALMREKPEHTELVTTGRDAPDEAIAAADLATEMRPLKHYFEQGVKARIGIEF